MPLARSIECRLSVSAATVARGVWGIDIHRATEQRARAAAGYGKLSYTPAPPTHAGAQSARRPRLCTRRRPPPLPPSPPPPPPPSCPRVVVDVDVAVLDHSRVPQPRPRGRPRPRHRRFAVTRRPRPPPPHLRRRPRRASASRCPRAPRAGEAAGAFDGRTPVLGGSVMAAAPTP